MRGRIIPDRAWLGLLLCIVLLSSARGGDWPPWIPRLKATPGEPNTLEQIARSIDSIEDKILDDGTVVLKQPDVYSQSRMTLYRKNFEAQLYNAIGQFNTVLSARLFRSDQAAFLSQTSLAAAAATAKSRARGSTTTNTTVAPTAMAPPTLIAPGTGPGITPNGLAPNSIVRPDALTAFGTPFQNFANGSTPYGLGVEPTIYLDELKRYQDHLNQLRRVNMGDDIADSPGYGLYLVRMPISIQPGEMSHHGHGAILTATLRHEFGNDFLTSTYRNLVINDLVDQLSPLLYALIRADSLKTVADLENLDEAFRRYLEFKSKDRGTPEDDLRFIFRNLTSETRERGYPERLQNSAQITLTRVNARSYPIAPTEMYNVFLIRNLYILALHARDTLLTKEPRATDVRSFLRRELESAYDIIAQTFRGGDRHAAWVAAQYEQQVEIIAAHIRNQEYSQLGQDYRNLAAILPGDFQYVAWGPATARRGGSGVRRAAFQRGDQDAGEGVDRVERPAPAPGGLQPELVAPFRVEAPARPGIGPDRPPPAVPDQLPAGPDKPPAVPDQPLPIEPGPDAPAGAGLVADPNNSLFQAMTILAYAIAVESAILNGQLRLEVKRVLGRGGVIRIGAGLLNERFRTDLIRVLGRDCLDCAAVDRMRFYSSCPDLVTRTIFEAYVAKRWPIITFALDPVVDQQNIADASSVKRDLQLALAFAFSTGQINFNQLTQFQRRIQQDAETIALNRTVTAFAHSNDTFGYRFTPRYQNPPLERSNFQVIANQLIRGGPGRNYQMKNSKLEPGQRELSVVMLMPSFLHGVHMDVTGNWFPLHDPDQMEVPTPRMIAQGRQVVALRQALESIHDHALYREGDFQRLQTRVYQLEEMLPMQTREIDVPFENTLGGFALFQQGITSLVPELNGFEGARAVEKAAPGTDLFLFGKHFSVQETNVIIGGVYLSSNSLNVHGSNQTGLMNNTLTPPSAATNLVTLAGGINPSGSPFTILGPAVTPTTSPTITTANNPAIDIISREVLRVSIPRDVRPTPILDADRKERLYVEVFVATPTGISNRLLVPYADTAPAAAAPVAYAIDPGSQLTINYSLDRDDRGTIRPVNGVPDPKCALTLNWTSPLGAAPQNIQVAIRFTYNKNAKLTIPLARPIVRGSGGKYKLAAGDLQRIAHDFIEEIAKIDPNVSLAAPLQPITVDSVEITPDDPNIDAQTVKATGSLIITPQIVNDVADRTTADPALLPARFRRPAPSSPRTGLPSEEFTLPPLPPTPASRPRVARGRRVPQPAALTRGRRP